MFFYSRSKGSQSQLQKQSPDAVGWVAKGLRGPREFYSFSRAFDELRLFGVRFSPGRPYFMIFHVLLLPLLLHYHTTTLLSTVV